MGDESTGIACAAATQRVPPLRTRHLASSRSGVRVDGHRVAVSRRRFGCRRRRSRDRCCPVLAGDVYDTYSLTEDNELTLALKTLGARMVSPRRVSGADRADADLARPVASTATLAARCAREHRNVRDDFGDGPKLDPAVRPRIRRRLALSYLADARRVVLPRLRCVDHRRLLGDPRALSSPWSEPSPCGPAAGEHVFSPRRC